ncbi:hypothetical protein Zmor_010400 [Zophobas morio]|uniref:Transposable element P transposase-like RNase H domain-containing protein n=2 Tax=Zophobas morio TaxID=2755281 RepID=A0AA38INC0_9CUCU|nr:hypothetical protein Zmor_010400 [Zophobas morio]
MLRTWISIIGGDLLQMSLEDIYNKKRICKCHFTDNYFNPGCKGLLRTAVPTLYVPMCMKDTEKRTFDDAFVEESSFSVCTPSAKKIATDVTVDIVDPNLENAAVDMSPVPTTPTKNQELQGLLKSVGVNKAIHLTPKASTLYQAATSLKRKVQYLHKKCRGFKSRLAAATKLSESEAFQRVASNMSVAAKLFTNLQMRETHKKSRGRRFSLEEKILSLTMYKQSPKAYRLLQKLFTLPARKTLTSLLQKVVLNTGLNMGLFKNLKTKVERIPLNQRYCSLIFDEMSIMPSLQYDEHQDRIIGFQDK